MGDPTTTIEIEATADELHWLYAAVNATIIDLRDHGDWAEPEIEFLADVRGDVFDAAKDLEVCD